MQAAERERKAETQPRRNAQEIGALPLCLSLLICLVLLAAMAMSYQGAWSPAELGSGAVLLAVAVCLALSLVSQRRFWWAPRLIAGGIAFMSLATVYLTAWYPPELGRDPRLPAVFMVTVCFLVLGVPALCFMLWGHTQGKLARLDVSSITTMDLWTARLLVLLRYALIIAVGFYLLRLFYLDLSL